MVYTLKERHMRYIRTYLKDIDHKIRPRVHTNNPLFVAFNNLNLTYFYDYGANRPKALAVRSIQEMIKDEVKRAGLRSISAKHIRNRLILMHNIEEKSDEVMQRYFGLKHPHSLHRYKTYKDSL